MWQGFYPAFTAYDVIIIILSSFDQDRRIKQFGQSYSIFKGWNQYLNLKNLIPELVCLHSINSLSHHSTSTTFLQVTNDHLIIDS